MGYFGRGPHLMSDYRRLRYWYLHELRTLRAQRRNGLQVKSQRKFLQRELAKLRSRDSTAKHD
jgi:hypothetical protein